MNKDLFLFDNKNIDTVKEKLRKELIDVFFPFVSIHNGKIGEQEHIFITISLDDKRTFENGILQNSSYGQFCLNKLGELKIVARKGDFPIIRKSQNKSIDQVIKRLIDKLGKD